MTGGHLSLYQLTIEENTAFHHAYKNGGFTLPDEAEAEALYRLTEAMTAAHGLNAYEISNYAAPGEASRHNLSYWRGDDYIGVGPGAHGRISPSPLEGEGGVGGEGRSDVSARTTPHPNPPPQGGRGLRIATATLKSPERWLSQVEQNGHALEVWQTVDTQAEIEERLMMGLRLRGGIDYAEFHARTGIDLSCALRADKVALYQKQGLLENDPARLTPTLSGRLVLNRLTAELLR